MTTTWPKKNPVKLTPPIKKLASCFASLSSSATWSFFWLWFSSRGASFGSLSPSEFPPGDKADTELYEKFIKNSDDSTKPESETDPPVHAPEVIEYQDKQIICEVNRTARADDSQKYSDKGTDLMHPKACQRTQSEKLEGEGSEKYAGKLRRTETEKCLKAANSEENRPENPCPEDEMSNEDFQRTIEAFIAKQRKFRRQESLPIVVHNQIGVPVGN
ncbi:hypothetical protein I3760_02G021200 [Carya illinoinensis]|nr:hypothetical protein I3760_02G021200 [Carya illinoinensis]